MIDNIYETFGNKEWLIENEQMVRNLLPAQWTHVDSIDFNDLLLKFQGIGIDVNHLMDLVKLLVFFEQIGMMFKDGPLFKANPKSIFEFKVD